MIAAESKHRFLLSDKAKQMTRRIRTSQVTFEGDDIVRKHGPGPFLRREVESTIRL